MEEKDQIKNLKDDSFLRDIKPDDYREELIKYRAINTQLVEKENENAGIITSLRNTINEKDNALREISKSFDIEKSVNERMKNILEHSQTITKKELNETEQYDEAIEALNNYNKKEIIEKK